MPYVEDIFISYAHADNETLDKSLDGWVELLEDRLRVRLKQLLGKKQYQQINIWRDPQLRGYGDFSEELKAQLEKTKVFISILSPSYIQSDWCQRELKEFTGRGGKERILKIVKTPIPRKEEPEMLRDLLGYHFYEEEVARSSFTEFDPYLIGIRDKRYWDKFEDLCRDAAELINRLSVSPAPTPPAPDAPAAPATAEQPESVVIYLAETSTDLKTARDSIWRAFPSHVKALPQEELPENAPDLINKVSENLKQARLSIHLIGSRYGSIPDEEKDRSIVRLQHELATQRVREGNFTRLVWMPRNLTSTDERQQKFIDDLRSHSNAESQDELIESELEELKTIIQSKCVVAQPAARVEPEEVKPAGVIPAAGELARPVVEGEVEENGKPSVYLVCDQGDHEEVKPVYSHLFINERFKVKLSKTTGSVAEIRQDRKEGLLSCDAVLIYFGRVKSEWLSSQLDELLKVFGYGRRKPFLARAIYAASPRTDEKEFLEYKDPLIIKNFNGFRPDSLAEFVARIREAKGHP